MNDLLALMHDTAHPLMDISYVENSIEKQLKVLEKEDISKDDITDILINIRENLVFLRRKRHILKTMLDNYYIKNKNL